MIVENAPLNFVRPGNYYWSSGQLGDSGTDGPYWSSTASSTTYSHCFEFILSEFRPQYKFNDKGYGLSVRHITTKFSIFQLTYKTQIKYKPISETSPHSSTSPSVIVENAPLNFVRSGYYLWSDGITGHRNDNGLYWSSTADSSIDSFDFNFYYEHFGPGFTNNKGFGFSVRCIT